ncbi:2-hydroxy-3-oxopropionate reductase [gamma proteobacterium HdN1]|nr:2-hydroxy-3-oxopropionate reductase [gamma proteobacterium HdN1]
MKLSFIGLGVMGFPMAGHLANAGHDVTVYNRTATKAQKWLSQYAGQHAATPRYAASGADIVFTCVGNDADLDAVVRGPEGILEGIKTGGIIVDHSTVSAKIARELNQAAGEKGAFFIDAPISGGQQGAEKGCLTVMCGGDPSAYERARPIIMAYARECQRLGESGSGQLTKMVNQICIAGLIQSLAEALNFANQAGLDAAQVVEVISKGAAQSWQMENRHKTMLAGEYEHGFAVDWMRKDLGICLDEARRNGSSLPVAALVDQFYAQIQQAGGGRFDTSSLLLNLTK